MINTRYKYEFRCFVSDYDLNFDIASIYRDGDKRFMAQPVVYEEREPNTFCHENMMHLDRDGASNLMDALWIAGIRPSEKIIEPMNRDHMNGEIDWLRGVADHLMKRPTK